MNNTFLFAVAPVSLRSNDGTAGIAGVAGVASSSSSDSASRKHALILGMYPCSNTSRNLNKTVSKQPHEKKHNR